MTPKNALDHVVVGVPDLASARLRLEALGFQVQPDAHHPFGTGNCNVFFANDTYFEPLAVTDRDAELAALKEPNVFISRYDAFRFRHGYGPVMAAFTTHSAREMQERFEADGISAGDILSFTRKQAMPEGGETTIGVHLAVSSWDRAPDITLFACEHLTREILWRPERTEHPNGAIGIGRLIAVEPNPSDFQYMFQRATGDRDLRTTSVGIEMDLPNAYVSVLSPDAYEAMTDQAVAPWGRGPRIMACEIVVEDLGAMQTILEGNSVSYAERDGSLIIPPQDPFGCTLIVMEADA
ncbi:MAG: VOC family protein [Pseudomonadota bacterium]